MKNNSTSIGYEKSGKCPTSLCLIKDCKARLSRCHNRYNYDDTTAIWMHYKSFEVR